MDCQRVPFNVKELFDSIINSYRPVAANRNIELASSCAPELDSVFKGDPLRIRQIIDNLVGNAFKFTKEGSVAVNAMLKGESLYIMVSDTGCGISAEDMNRIFKEFTRLKNAQGKEGFGLGLAITNKLVRLLGGEIDVRSRQGEGTTFEVRLPLEHTEQSLNSNVKANGDFVVPGARLLLIDDDPLQLSMMEAMLKQSPLAVTTCNHPDEFFIYLQQQQYDVIITDIQMPAMNGIDLINNIKEFPNAAQVPVIAMTARSDMDAELLSQHGFATCLHKPFASKELLSVIASVVKKGGSKIDFSQLTAFSMDDDEAKVEIMQTFVSETKKKRDLLQQACEMHDMPAVTTITHQLLPLFVMVGAVNGKEHLEWFEKHRNDTLFTDDAGARVVTILAETDKIITEAEKELTR
jgi:DNA-binding response OmpR family regulator/anti-sigma regulatory factor (Ser/Thr protein kinase)